MNETPRLRSAFPSTPRNQPNGSPGGGSGIGTAASPKLPDVKSLVSPNPQPSGPVIPTDTLDAPSQRLYVVGIYTAIFFWRLYDFYHLNVDETESLWLFMKWISIDGLFLFGLPGLRIPWLEWSSSTMTVLFLLHAVLDGIMMFRIPIPLGSALVALSKVLYDRGEASISGGYIKPADVLQKPNLILGRQIIHILPEGSAVLNPDNSPLCVDSSRSSTVTLPIRINQTNPILIELTRYDLGEPSSEVISITSRQANNLRKAAEKERRNRDSSSPLTIQYPVKRTGLYRLTKMVDETKLEVTVKPSEALVVSCPSASIKANGNDRCRGDLSDLSIEVQGTPPLRVKYRKITRGEIQEFNYQSIQPDEFVSPLARRKDLQSAMDTGEIDALWAKARTVTVPLNETMATSGTYSYQIDSVSDAMDNVIRYEGEDDYDASRRGPVRTSENLVVHDRPKVALSGHDMQRPILSGTGKRVNLPLAFTSTNGRSGIEDTPHIVEYIFTPEIQIKANGQHSDDPEVVIEAVETIRRKPTIQKPGLYTLRSVSTPFCSGEVLEPASCLLVNPPQPDLTITSEAIADKCAGRPIGLSVALDFVGTPPFRVQYTSKRRGDSKSDVRWQQFDGLRGQIELKPPAAGHYTYTFTELEDHVYRGVSLKSRDLVLQQDVKPSVYASFVKDSPQRKICLDESTTFDVKFQGEGPWTLEYELAHNGRRTKQKLSDISTDIYTLQTPELQNGGEFALVLTGVSDSMGCREGLQEEAKIFVRHQKPKVSFGKIEGGRSIRTLESKPVQLPVRLSGSGPWTVEFEDQDGSIKTKNMQHTNDLLQVTSPGTYKLKSVRDSVCPGSVDESANSFEITYVERPKVLLPEDTALTRHGYKFIRAGVCEGQDDAFDVLFSGRAPYRVVYNVNVNPDQGQRSTSSREMNVPLSSASIKMDTAKAGLHEYKFTEIGDSNYDHDSKRHKTLTVEQRVFGRPDASFKEPGKVYSFCHGEERGQDEEVIPINLSGEPPFTLDLELRHSARGARPQPITVPNINSKAFNVHLSHSQLTTGGSSLVIRRVRDGRGCERVTDSLSPQSQTKRVRVAVHELASIIPTEERTHYCVGERIGFTLTGVAPFTVLYTFDGKERKATLSEPLFRRIAESAGNFTVTSISDAASGSFCKRQVSHTKLIHPMPTARMSKGKVDRVDIHAGSETDILLEFGGTPPFEFTYTRSENADSKGRRKGLPAVLETKTLMSEERSFRLKAGEEGTYEIVAIADRYCSFAKQGAEELRTPRMLKEA